MHVDEQITHGSTRRRDEQHDDDDDDDDEHAYRSYKTTTVHVVKTNVCVSTKFGKLSKSTKDNRSAQPELCDDKNRVTCAPTTW